MIYKLNYKVEKIGDFFSVDNSDGDHLQGGFLTWADCQKWIDEYSEYHKAELRAAIKNVEAHLEELKQKLTQY
jgi:hypothetical protein